MDQNNISYTLELDDLANQLIVFHKSLFDTLLKECGKNFSEAYALYGFYYYTAKWQKTNQPKCTNYYVEKGLKWGKDKVQKYKKILLDLGLIQNIQKIDPKTKKTIGWFIKINHIVKKENIQKVIKIQTPCFPEGGIFQKVENTAINALSTSSLNALSTNTKSIINNTIGNKQVNSSITPLGIDPSVIEDNILNIIKGSVEWGGFSLHRLPKPGQEPSKTVKRVISYIHQIKKGVFFAKNKWDKDWLNKCDIKDIDGKPVDWKITTRIIKTACERYKLQRTDDYGSDKKSLLKKSFADFLYNARNQNSQFLYTLSNKPQTSEKHKLKLIKNKIEKKFRNKAEEIYNNYKGDYFSVKEETLFFSKVVKLKNWYDKNYDDINLYNEVTCGNRFNWRVGSFDALLDKIDEFYEDQSNGTIFGVSGMMDPIEFSKGWEQFTNILREEEKVELVVSAGMLEGAQKVKAKRVNDALVEAIDKEIDESGVSREEAIEYIRRRKEISKLVPKHKKLLEQEYEKIGKEIHPRVLKDEAYSCAAKELGYDDY